MTLIRKILVVIGALTFSTNAYANDLMRGGTDDDYAAIQAVQSTKSTVTFVVRKRIGGMEIL